MNDSTTRKVMHVDDDPQFCRLVKVKLEKVGYEVTSVCDPRSVLSLLLDSDYRVVLLDIEMPKVNGLELLKQIKQQDGGVQVVMLTGVQTMSTVLRSMRWGAEACVFKPFTDESVLLNALDASFAKIDRWWNSLQELKTRKQADTATLTSAAV